MRSYLLFVQSWTRLVQMGMCWLGVLAFFLLGVWPFRPEQSHAQVGGAVLYVALTGNDTESCGSISSPCRSIQYAVNKARSGDTILVAGGTYTYNPNNDPCGFLITRAVVCFVDKELTILGGYSAANWMRDPQTNPSIIDGKNTYRGVAIVSYNGIASLQMEGFTIRNGRAVGKTSGGDWDISAFGGGMWAQNSAVTLKDVVFEGNIARGGDTAFSSVPYGGSASGGGLAIQSPPLGRISRLERVIFQNNQALGGLGRDRGGFALGGGLFVYRAVVSMNAITFTNNVAWAGNATGIGEFGGLRSDALGGGAAFQIGSNITLRNVVAKYNRAVGGNASQKGGGGFGGALHIEEGTLVASDAWIESNQTVGGTGAEEGGVGFSGGLEVLNSQVLLERAWVMKNEAIGGGATGPGGYAGSAGGGGAYLWDFRPLNNRPSYRHALVNVSFTDNRIVMSTSGSSVKGGGGGGLVVQGMEVDIVHSTFARNTLSENLIVGQAILVHGTEGGGGIPGIANIYYSIIADHINPHTDYTSALNVSVGSTAKVNRCLFANNTNNTNADGRPMPPGTIEILNPIYASSAGFVSPGAPNYDYHLTPTSPAVNQAIGSTTSVDIDGQPRPYPPGGTADIGADEYVRPRLTVTPPQVAVMVEGNTVTTRSAVVDVIYTSTAVTWNATHSASWLSLSPSSGQTGKSLTLRLNSTDLPLGTYDAQVQITSAEADSVTLPVRMIKVEKVFNIHLPLILRSR